METPLQSIRFFSEKQLTKLQELGIASCEHLASLTRDDLSFHHLCELLGLESDDKLSQTLQFLAEFRHKEDRALLFSAEHCGMGLVTDIPQKLSESADSVEDVTEIIDWDGLDLPSSATVLHKAVTEDCPIKNQGRRGTCVAQAGCKAMESAHGGTIKFSPQHLYWLLKQNDGIPDQSGSYIHTSSEVLHAHGVCREETFPYQPTNDGNPECGPYPPHEAENEATEFRTAKNVNIYSGSSILKAIKAAVSGALGIEPRALNAGFKLFQSFGNEYTSRTGRVNLPLPNESVRGGHAMAVAGYCDDSDWPGGGYVQIINSWGTAWAEDSPDGPGIGRMPYAYVEQYAHCGALYVLAHESLGNYPEKKDDDDDLGGEENKKHPSPISPAAGKQGNGQKAKDFILGFIAALVLVFVFLLFPLDKSKETGISKDEAEKAYQEGMALLEDPLGGPNPEAAFELFMKASGSKHPGAMLELGNFYNQGINGLPADPEAARAWWQRSARAGNQDAEFLLKVYPSSSSE